MNNFQSLLAAMLFATTMVGPQVSGQTVYRCANVYSQTPCPGAVIVDASDSRTPAQKAQTDAATAKAAKSADKMEQERLAMEKRLAVKATMKTLRSNQPGAAAKSERPAAKASGGQKKKGPEYFTAAVAPDPKKEKKAPMKADDTP